MVDPDVWIFVLIIEAPRSKTSESSVLADLSAYKKLPHPKPEGAAKLILRQLVD